MWEAMSTEQALGMTEDPEMRKLIPEWLPEELLTYNVVRTSQSFLNSYQKCPRSAVADRNRPTYGHAAAVGVLSHAIVDGRITHQGIFPEVDLQYRDEKMEELTSDGWVPDDLEAFYAEVMAKADVLTDVYMAKYHQFVPYVETEPPGSLTWDVRDRPGDVDFIVMTGSADLVITPPLGRRFAVDWKTGSQMPEPWVVQRYGIQWRAYAVMFDLDEMFFEYPIALNPLNGGKGNWVANRYNGVVHCTARPEEREAFRQQLVDESLPVAEALLRSTDPEDHPILPTQWHCSARWCQVFAAGECVGRHTDVAWIRKSHEDAAK